MKKLLLICSISLLGNFFVGAQTTETFEDETDNALSFTSGTQTFNLGGSFHIENFGGYGLGPSDYYIDVSNSCGPAGPMGIITTNNGSEAYLNSVWVYISNNCVNTTSGTIDVTWHKNGAQVSSKSYTFTTDINVNNGFVQLDFDGDGQSVFDADEWRFTATSPLNYMAIDDFMWTAIPCTDPDIPTITVTPSTICPGGSATLSWTGNLNDATQWHIYTGSCGGTQLTTTATNSLVVSPGVTTTYYIRGEDGAGCVDESTGLCGQVTVTVQDITDPTITCPGNQVGSVGAACTFSLPDYTGLATTADNCTASPTVTQSPAAGTNVGPGTTVITLTATDGSSNTANCNFNVVVSDNTNPTIVCPGNQVGSVDASCNFSLPDYTSLATPTDNCPGVVVTQVPAAGTNVGVGTTNIVLTATDGASNTANCNFDVVVSDNTNPTISCPGNQVGSVDGSCNFSLPDYTSLATPADNCPGVVVTQVPVAGTIVGVGTTNIVLTATDGASNTANCNFDVVVSDNTNPTISCPGNQVGSVDGSCNFSLPDYTSLATPADNCPGVVVTQVPAAGTIVGVGTTNIVLTATDGASNTANCNFDVVVSDNTNPTISCPGNQVGSVDGSCNFSLPDYTSLATPTDNCPGVVVTQVPAAGTIVGVGTTNIVLTATDGSSNTANCNFDVVVSDNTNPTISCPGNQTENPDASCQFTLPDYTGLVTAADNCSGSPTVTQSPVAGTVIAGNTTIMMTADDGNGNTAQCTFDVTLNDVTAPTAVCQNISVYLDGAGNATIVTADIDGGSADNCAGLTLSASQTAFTCADLGANNVTLTATDGNSNTSNCVAVVTVLDTISPTIACPTDIAACAGDIVTFATPTGADNCSQTVTQTDVTGLSSGMAFPIGVTTIEFTSTDGSGNTAVCTFTVTVTGIDNSVTNSSPTLTANQTGATYQWLDCNNGNAMIPTETNQAFTATVNGDYAVEITLGTCVDTSACENVIIISVDENSSLAGTSIYPNPTTSLFTIALNQVESNASVMVYSVVGKQVVYQTINSSISQVDLSKFDKGVYFVQIQNGDQTTTQRIIKQ